MTGRITLMDSTGDHWVPSEFGADSWETVERPPLTGWRRADIERCWGPTVEVVEPAEAVEK